MSENIKVAEHYFWVGSRSMSDKPDLAVENFTKAIEYNPKLLKAYIGRADAYKSQQKCVPAIEDYTIAIKMDSENAELYLNRGLMYSQKSLSSKLNEDCDNAVADFSKALELTPENYAIYTYRGFAYTYKKDYLNATKDFSVVVGKEPNLVSYMNRAEAYFSNGDIKQAIADFEVILKFEPKSRSERHSIEEAKKKLDLLRKVAKYKNIFDAYKARHVDVIEYFIKYKRQANMQDRSGKTIWHYIARDPKGLLMNLILGGKCNEFYQDNKDKKGNTPLHIAAKYNKNIEVIKFFIYQGAEVNARNKGFLGMFTKTPFDVADTEEKKQILRAGRWNKTP